jgi:hypothetical protein
VVFEICTPKPNGHKIQVTPVGVWQSSLPLAKLRNNLSRESGLPTRLRDLLDKFQSLQSS